MKRERDNQSKEPKQKKNKLLFIVLGVLIGIIILFIGAGLVMRVSLKDKVVEPITTNEIEEVIVPNEQLLEVVSENNDLIKGGTDNNEIVNEVVLYDYENKLIGLKFDYATDMYIKENTDVVFNTLKSVAQEGKNFKINKDKLAENLNILQLTTGAEDGLLITVGLHPLQIVGVDTENLVVEDIVGSEITQDDLQEFDRVLKDEITKSGSEIIAFENSYIKSIHNLQAIITERKYSGSTETKTGVVDVIQGIVPVGVNAVVITAITDGSPIDIDKSVLFNEIIESLMVDFYDESVDSKSQEVSDEPMILGGLKDTESPIEP